MHGGMIHPAAAPVDAQLAELLLTVADAKRELDVADDGGADAADEAMWAEAGASVEPSPFDVVEAAVDAALSAGASAVANANANTNADATADVTADVTAAASSVPVHATLVAALEEQWSGRELVACNQMVANGDPSAMGVGARAEAAAQEFVLPEGPAEGSAEGSGPWRTSRVVGARKLFRLALTCTRSPDVVQEFLALDTSTLAELRERLSCPHDVVRGGPSRRGNYFFFFSRVFFASAASTDLAHPVADWARRRRGEAWPVRTVAGVTFGDVAICGLLSLENPGLFMHQGDCEHRLALRGARWAHDRDALAPALYPMLTLGSGMRRPMCMLCGKLRARFACYGDGLSGEEPSRLCAPCFLLCFCDQHGRRLPKHARMEVHPCVYAG